MTKLLIINADDFGHSRGVNRGIIAAHVQGVVTSASLMVDAPWATAATAEVKQHPSLGVGLHFDVTSDHKTPLDLNDVGAVARELQRQYLHFCDLVGKEPTHIDSHHHVHLRDPLKPLFLSWAGEHHVPIRGLGQIRYDGRFYGQWYDEHWHPLSVPEWISVEHLETLLRTLSNGVTELACHPGFVTDDLDSSYRSEREIELATLLDGRVVALIRALNIRLVNFADVSNGHRNLE
jgi:chitin disaccharide deacetylase